MRDFKFHKTTKLKDNAFKSRLCTLRYICLCVSGRDMYYSINVIKLQRALVAACVYTPLDLNIIELIKIRSPRPNISVLQTLFMIGDETTSLICTDPFDQ